MIAPNVAAAPDVCGRAPSQAQDASAMESEGISSNEQVQWSHFFRSSPCGLPPCASTIVQPHALGSPAANHQRCS